MKKIVCLVSAMLMAVSGGACALMSGCGNDKITLRICNWEDYIYEDEETELTLADEFVEYYKEKTGKDVEIEYSTFSTPEEVYNTLNIDSSVYDLICPSDYMIEKMAREGMLAKIEPNADGNYETYVSPYIKDVFDGITWKNDGSDEEVSLSDYAMGYMWGTLGLVYDSDKVDEDDMKTWSSLWNDKYDEKFSIKDSVRDTYFVGLAKAYYTELAALDKAAADYNAKITEIFNRTDATSIAKVKTELTALKDKSFCMEVDSGKNDVVSGKIAVYFAWSGDAVYAMDEADALETPVTLGYSVPEEGSNVWFDGWCIPKDSKNKEIAVEFMEFISSPENAIKNMEYIGYVSCVAGSDVFDWVNETYGEDGGEHSVDLSYFFGEGDYTVTTSTLGRQFSAQYPSKDVIARCAVMSYFEKDANNSINTMWSEIKA